MAALVDALGALLAQLPDLPTPQGEDDFPIPPGLFFALFALGFLMGIVGQAIKSRTLTGSGIALVFLATAVFVVLSFHANQ